MYQEIPINVSGKEDGKLIYTPKALTLNLKWADKEFKSSYVCTIIPTQFTGDVIMLIDFVFKTLQNPTSDSGITIEVSIQNNGAILSIHSAMFGTTTCFTFILVQEKPVSAVGFRAKREKENFVKEELLVQKLEQMLDYTKLVENQKETLVNLQYVLKENNCLREIILSMGAKFENYQREKFIDNLITEYSHRYSKYY